MSKKRLKGTIISDKMDKTAVVRVETLKKHPKYRKRVRMFKKYMADNPNNNRKEGEEVIIEESHPLSKRKKWRIVEGEK